MKYKDFTALDGFSCDIPEGCIGLLGPNGAGKTTFLKTLLGFVKPVRGSADILGHDIERSGARIRQLVGLMPEQDCHIPGMSAVQFVAYAGELAGMPPAQALRRAHEVLEYCSLGEARYRNVETYSTGMKQRIKLAQALVHGPKLLLLDEPTNGLDPAGIHEIRTTMRRLADEGRTVLVSSHILAEVEQVADTVSIVGRGRLLATGTVAEVIGDRGGAVRVGVPDPARAAQVLAAAGLTVRPDGDRLLVEGEREPGRITWLLAQQNLWVHELTPVRAGLEGVFLELTQGTSLGAPPPDGDAPPGGAAAPSSAAAGGAR